MLCPLLTLQHLGSLLFTSSCKRCIASLVRVFVHVCLFCSRSSWDVCLLVGYVR